MVRASRSPNGNRNSGRALPPPVLMAASAPASCWPIWASDRDVNPGWVIEWLPTRCPPATIEATPAGFPPAQAPVRKNAPRTPAAPRVCRMLGSPAEWAPASKVRATTRPASGMTSTSAPRSAAGNASAGAGSGGGAGSGAGAGSGGGSGAGGTAGGSSAGGSTGACSGGCTGGAASDDGATGVPLAGVPVVVGVEEESVAEGGAGLPETAGGCAPGGVEPRGPDPSSIAAATAAATTKTATVTASTQRLPPAKIDHMPNGCPRGAAGARAESPAARPKRPAPETGTRRSRMQGDAGVGIRAEQGRTAVKILIRYPLVAGTVAALLAVIVLMVSGQEGIARVAASLYALAVAAYLAVGMVRRLIGGTWGIDILAVTAIVSTVLVGEFVASMIIVLMMAGGTALEDYAAGRAKAELTALLERVPQTAHRERAGVSADGTHQDGSFADGQHEDVAATDVRIGDILLVRPGEVVPLDGVLLSDSGTFDESSLTGESLPVERAAGEGLMSGSLNGEAA